ncbi:hypothetical protein GXB85_05315 [Cellulomonas sp. APG4]|uniref:hypothetical protein n=1 Tax=Cellulomonas sp. APG4 TaxID=1538656 RepID=UPI00137B40AB|nr:hypothetical protein [Cellulomonas sp. APG4]NCT90370.1 hypothetical protein [Cellulomonas sp. APG4]
MAQTPEVPKQLLGTVQYPDAGDLSSYLIHMTSSGEALASILTQGCVEARNPFGFVYKRPELAATHMAVCLTEAPANELGRITARKSQFGVVFHRDFIRDQGGQRVWYINHGTPTWEAFLHEADRLRALNEDSRFFELTPFIDMVRPGSYAFDWEREWRVLGHLRFEWEDVAYLITPEEGLLTFEDQPEVGSGGFNIAEGDYEWSGGTFTELDEAMNVLMREFLEEFEGPEQHLWLDRESEDGFNWGGFRRWETEDAVEHLFGDRPEKVQEALRDHLGLVSDGWLSTSEYNEPPDDF